MILKRTFHPIGHGAFYTERFFADSKNTHAICNVVFDCGCFETAKTGYSRADYENRINDAIDATFSEGEVINALFISHFHTDHILGVPHLLQRCDVKKIFIPILTPDIVVEASLYNCWTSGSNDAFEYILSEKIRVPERFCEIKEVDKKIKLTVQPTECCDCVGEMDQSIIKIVDWQYIPYNCVKNLKKKSKVLEGLGLQEGASTTEISNTIKGLGANGCKAIYQQIFGDKHNSYSMTVLSFSSCKNQCKGQCLDNILGGIPRYCSTNCLYMGDFEANDRYPSQNQNFEDLRNFYGDYIKKVGVVQVPHHGSEHNFNDKLYEKGKISVISASRDDKYGHPDDSVLSGLRDNNCITLLVTEDPKTMQEFTININSALNM